MRPSIANSSASKADMAAVSSAIARILPRRPCGAGPEKGEEAARRQGGFGGGVGVEEFFEEAEQGGRSPVRRHCSGVPMLMRLARDSTNLSPRKSMKLRIFGAMYCRLM